MTPSIAIKIAIVSLLWLPMHVFASPFDAGRIPADADGVGHLDMDALRRTSLHRLLAPRIKGAHWNDVDQRIRPLALALLDAGQSVSFWLTDRDTGAVLIRVPDPARIKALLDKIPHKGQLRVAGYPVRRYDIDKDEPTLIAMVGNFLVLTDDEPSLAKAIGAASGKGKTLAGARAVVDSTGDAGLFFFAALNDKLLDEVKDAARSHTLRIDMSSLTVKVSEVRAEVRLRVKMMMGNVDEAQKIKSMVDGLVALASMSDDAAEIRPFTKGLRVTANGKAVEIALSMPAADLVKLIDSKN
jgi:hypothetical protein